MVAFLVEAYCSAEELAADKSRFEVVTEAADPVMESLAARLIHAVYVPNYETCFYLFEATSAEAVSEAADRLALRFDHINEAVMAWPASVGEKPERADIDLTATRSRGRPRPEQPQEQGGSPLR